MQWLGGLRPQRARGTTRDDGEDMLEGDEISTGETSSHDEQERKGKKKKKKK
ncbi:Hypothetical protein FKW44_002377 [Caligus rogercresseyi]|uniref:Uncharacterized protein n=1 Tax=Caligus rogercresseyi TaxID=217165 RepID=A0A7T8KKA3_CALRO|nr:Hypothetical protein FKW44_002377 [Caligus rogercresseyi]